jgi:hypothetical protein
MLPSSEVPPPELHAQKAHNNTGPAQAFFFIRTACSSKMLTVLRRVSGIWILARRYLETLPGTRSSQFTLVSNYAIEPWHVLSAHPNPYRDCSCEIPQISESDPIRLSLVSAIRCADLCGLMDDRVMIALLNLHVPGSIPWGHIPHASSRYFTRWLPD